MDRADKFNGEIRTMKGCLILCGLILIAGLAGCAPAVVGAGAAGGYKVATDERGVGRVWDDATITTKVKNALGESHEVRARKIDVDTVEGAVILTGIVETQEEARKAVDIAEGVPGVKEVKNNLQVGSRSWGQAFDDKVIGVVTLTGIVGYQHQKDRVMEIARTTSGVIEVVDNIKVTHP